VMTETLVNRVIVEKRDGKQVAIRVELANGELLSAKKEIIISAGAYRTPQVLLLSGIGPAEELRKHGIEQVVKLPEVGSNLHDHMGVGQSYALRPLDDTRRADISEQMEAPKSRERLLSWFSSI
jgi:choline dehydrogenase-like flavoprotein